MSEIVVSFSNDTGFNDSMMHASFVVFFDVNKRVKRNKCVLFSNIRHNTFVFNQRGHARALRCRHADEADDSSCTIDSIPLTSYDL